MGSVPKRTHTTLLDAHFHAVKLIDTKVITNRWINLNASDLHFENNLAKCDTKCDALLNFIGRIERERETVVRTQKHAHVSMSINRAAGLHGILLYARKTQKLTRYYQISELYQMCCCRCCVATIYRNCGRCSAHSLHHYNCVHWLTRAMLLLLLLLLRLLFTRTEFAPFAFCMYFASVSRLPFRSQRPAHRCVHVLFHFSMYLIYEMKNTKLQLRIHSTCSYAPRTSFYHFAALKKKREKMILYYVNTTRWQWFVRFIHSIVSLLSFVQFERWLSRTNCTPNRHCVRVTINTIFSDYDLVRTALTLHNELKIQRSPHIDSYPFSFTRMIRYNLGQNGTIHVCLLQLLVFSLAIASMLYAIFLLFFSFFQLSFFIWQ